MRNRLQSNQATKTCRCKHEQQTKIFVLYAQWCRTCIVKATAHCIVVSCVSHPLFCERTEHCCSDQQPDGRNTAVRLYTSSHCSMGACLAVTRTVMSGSYDCTLTKVDYLRIHVVVASHSTIASMVIVSLVTPRWFNPVKHLCKITSHNEALVVLTSCASSNCCGAG